MITDLEFCLARLELVRSWHVDSMVTTSVLDAEIDRLKKLIKELKGAQNETV